MMRVKISATKYAAGVRIKRPGKKFIMSLRLSVVDVSIVKESFTLSRAKC
jgi:hypothetical protein